MSRHHSENQSLSRRRLLKSMGLAPLLLRPAPFFGSSFLFEPALANAGNTSPFPFSDIHFKPHYPAKSPLEDVLRLVPPGSDDYITEKYSFEIGLILRQWGAALRVSTRDSSTLARFLDAAIEGCSLASPKLTILREGPEISAVRSQFASQVVSGRENFLREIEAWLADVTRVETAEFELTSIKSIAAETIAAAPLRVRVNVRYALVGDRNDEHREERVGSWKMEWMLDPSGAWKASRWLASEEFATAARGPVFTDITAKTLGATESCRLQLSRGADHWRTVLDGACGIDVYGNNGVAAGDFDNDGFDDLYICQPAGLPNRLYRNRGDGTFDDVTEKAGVGVFDNTACALFADFRNIGRQDLLVVCGSGPLLFLNQGDGTFAIKRDAFQFATPPQGTFTHAALIDYDRDGQLDIYFCLYSYYLGLDQYHYPVPYFDARNGPPNFLLHNEGNATFVDRTEAAGLNADNNRYSFACAWGESRPNGLPDLYVANDFGRNSFYRNNGNGTFTSSATASHVEDVGAGMSACWSDVNNDGRPDIYVANMWSAAGQRVSGQPQFQQNASAVTRELYRRHAHGNALYKNQGDGQFENASGQAGVEMGRWAWCSDLWDFDHDGFPDIYVANGYISAPEPDTSGAHRADLGSFFWRQVVARSPEDSTPSVAYEHGWNALNELIRSDSSWSGHERNVMFVNNRDGTFSEASGAVRLDFPEDSRSFALADLDHDGRLEVVLKNRNAPQVRILHNDMQNLGGSIAFRLRGTKSNRDAIGAAITVTAGSLRQTRYLNAGSGFLAQHSKEIFFGLGKAEGIVRATVRWPSGLVQEFENIPANHRIELEEGRATFDAKAFAAVTPHGQEPEQPSSEPDSAPIETWLLDPLKAPAFSLPALDGKTVELQSYKGGTLLLTFWAASAAASTNLLRLLRQHQPAFAASRVTILAINIDDEASKQNARAFTAKSRFAFPVLFATEEVAGIYNIIYRYLYDRRRDLPIPASFLLDKEGMIVKVYQGPMDALQVLKDSKVIPATASERISKALPFPGTLYQGSFLRNDFTYGVAMFQHGYLDQAAESFQQVVAAKPDSAEGFYNLGTLDLRRNNFPQARAYLQQTLKLKPNYPEAWNNLGMMAAQEGDAEEAIHAFQQSLQLRPGYAIALLNLGNVYRRQGAFAKAQEALSQALTLTPDDPEVNYSLGMFYAQQNQTARATDYLQKAIELRPGYPEALNNLGIVYVREKNYAEAEEQFETCIRLSPDFDQSYINLARLYALQNEKEKAKAAVQQLLHLQPDNKNAAQAMDMLNSMP